MNIYHDIISLLKTSLLVDTETNHRILYGMLDERFSHEELLQIFLFLKNEDVRLQEYMSHIMNELSEDTLVALKGGMTHTRLEQIRDLERQDQENDEHFTFNI